MNMRNISLGRVLAIAFTTVLIGTANAQNITSYRYWFDDDVANLVSVPVTATPEMNTQISFNSAGLAIGYHTVTVQFKDADSHWSSPYTSVFSQKGGTLTALEYWFNDDLNSAIQLPVTATANLDLNAYYPISLGEKRELRFQADWFNVFNSQRAIRLDETFLINSGIPGLPGSTLTFSNPFYGSGTIFQFPSSLRLGVKFTF